MNLVATHHNCTSPLDYISHHALHTHIPVHHYTNYTAVTIHSLVLIASPHLHLILTLTYKQHTYTHSLTAKSCFPLANISERFSLVCLPVYYLDRWLSLLIVCCLPYWPRLPTGYPLCLLPALTHCSASVYESVFSTLPSIPLFDICLSDHLFVSIKLQVDLLSPLTSHSLQKTSPRMNPAVKLMLLRQGTRSIEDYVVDFLELAHLTHTDKICLMIFFQGGLSEPLRSIMPLHDPNWTLEKYIDTTLQLSGSPFTVGATQELAESAPEPAPSQELAETAPEPAPSQELAESAPEPAPSQELAESAPEPAPSQELAESAPEPAPSQELAESAPEPAPSQELAESAPEPAPSQELAESAPEPAPSQELAESAPEPAPSQELAESAPEPVAIQELAESGTPGPLLVPSGSPEPLLALSGSPSSPLVPPSSPSSPLVPPSSPSSPLVPPSSSMPPLVPSSSTERPRESEPPECPRESEPPERHRDSVLPECPLEVVEFTKNFHGGSSPPLLTETPDPPWPMRSPDPSWLPEAPDLPWPLKLPASESPHASADLPESPHASADLPESPHASADLPESPHASADLPESPHASADLPESPHVTAVYPVCLHVPAVSSALPWWAPVSLAPHGPGPPFPPPVPPPLHRPPGLCRVCVKRLEAVLWGGALSWIWLPLTTTAHHPWTTSPIMHCTHTFPSTITPITQLSPFTH